MLSIGALGGLVLKIVRFVEKLTEAGLKLTAPNVTMLIKLVTKDM